MDILDPGLDGRGLKLREFAVLVICLFHRFSLLESYVFFLYGHYDPTLIAYYESKPQHENSLSYCSTPSKTKQLSVFFRASHNKQALVRLLHFSSNSTASYYWYEMGCDGWKFWLSNLFDHSVGCFVARKTN